MILEMSDEEFIDMIESSEKYKIASIKTDTAIESITILANSYIYSFNSPDFKVTTERDPIKLRDKIINTINTVKIRGIKLIDIIEEKHRIDLSKLRTDTDG